MTTTPFMQGKLAFEQGHPDSVCPYAKSSDSKHETGANRTQWMSGYYEARTNKNVGHILNKKDKK